MNHKYAQYLTAIIFVAVAYIQVWGQSTSFSLVYDRVYLSGLVAPKVLRTNQNDNYLLVANGAEKRRRMLLRSYDRGETFELAASPTDFARVEDSPALFLWQNNSSAVIGNDIAQTLGTSALTSNTSTDMLEYCFRYPGNRAIPPVRTFEPGVGADFSRYTLDYGKTWKDFEWIFPNVTRDKVYSATLGFIGRKENGGSWQRFNTVTNTWQELTRVPLKIKRIRCTSTGTLIGFTSNSICWLRDADTAFTEQVRFRIPEQTDSVAIVLFEEEVTWRGDVFFCLALAGTDWYLLKVNSSFVELQSLKRSVPGSKFVMLASDELGCLVREQLNGRDVRTMLYDEDGNLVMHPVVRGLALMPSGEYNATWNTSSLYSIDAPTGQEIGGHLYRSTVADPRMEHIGRMLKGDAAIGQRSASWCLLDTLNGLLIGRDESGAVMEFENEPSMRGFLVHALTPLYQQNTADLAFELSVPKLIVDRSTFVIGQTSAKIVQRDSVLSKNVSNEAEPFTMLQKGLGKSFYFGRKRILKASYNGKSLDTITVALPNEKQDSIGVLSDIIELDSMNLVVALKGYKSQNFDGDSIAVIRGGIIRTTDRGATWKRADMPTADQAYYSMQQLKSGDLLAVSVDAAILTDTATKSSAVRCYSGNILRSSDEGATWTTQTSFVLNNQTLTQCSWRIWQGNERIYVATPEAVMISTDDGQTWTAVNEFPLNCIINGVAEYKGQLYVATTMGIYRENASTSIKDQGTRDQPAIQATATHSGQAWRITVTGLPTSRITGIDVYDIQGRQHQTEQLWSQDKTASITSPLPSNGIYGVVVHGPNGQRWTTAVGVFE